MRPVERYRQARQTLLPGINDAIEQGLSPESFAGLLRRIDEYRRAARLDRSKYAPHQGEREMRRRRLGGFYKNGRVCAHSEACGW